MAIPREIDDAPHRPKVRRLINLTNTELEPLFTMRAAAISNNLKNHEFWDNNRIVYWSKFSRLQEDLYEVMMEIQSRYPTSQISYTETLPVVEPRKIEG